MSSALDDALDAAEFTDAPTDDTPKRTRQPRSDKGVPRTRGVSNKQLVEDLLVPYAIIAEASALIAPTASALLITRGEKTVQALVKIGMKHPAMLKAMKTASVIGPGAEIATTIVGVVIAVAVDLGRIPPEHPLSLSTGVAQLYMEMHPDRFQPEPGNSMPWPQAPGPAFNSPFVPAQGK